MLIVQGITIVWNIFQMTSLVIGERRKFRCFLVDKEFSDDVHHTKKGDNEWINMLIEYKQEKV